MRLSSSAPRTHKFDCHRLRHTDCSQFEWATGAYQALKKAVLRRLLRKTRVNFICVYSVEPRRLTSQIGAQDKDTFRAAAQAGAIIIFFPPGRIYLTLATYGVIAPADGAPSARTRLIASGMPDTGGATPGVFCHSKPLPLLIEVAQMLRMREHSGMNKVHPHSLL